MYDPIQDGTAKSTQDVTSNEAKPSILYANRVHGYWQLKR
ncbi:MAG: hypothetical protein ACI88H_004199 [Cocleimonas sp.]|jgi:hypothetical protein